MEALSKSTDNITDIASIPTANNCNILMASLTRVNLFMFQEYANLTMHGVKHKIADRLMNIDRMPANLAKQHVTNINLKVQKNSLIYVTEYNEKLASEIYNLASQCGGAVCIKSRFNLLNDFEIAQLKTNNSMKAILEAKSSNKKYNFSIYMPHFTTKTQGSVYLNFFNIPASDIEHILKHSEINSLHLLDSSLGV